MPRLPPKPCTQPGCPAYATKQGRCDDHQRQPWSGKTSRSREKYGWDWSKLRSRILKRDEYLCQPCQRAGKLTTAKEVDHVLNIAAGGTDSPDNLQAICTTCHRAKTQQEASRPPGEEEI